MDDPKFKKLSEAQKTVFLQGYCSVRKNALSECHAMLMAGIPNDLAKYCLPEGFRTNFTWTINLRSLMNFIRLRHNMKAHFEIRHISHLIVEGVKSTWVNELLNDRI